MGAGGARAPAGPRGLFDLFLEVRNAAAAILDNTTLADLLARERRILVARGEDGGGRTEPK